MFHPVWQPVSSKNQKSSSHARRNPTLFEKKRKKVLTKCTVFGIIFFVRKSKAPAPIAQLDRAFDYESKGHRFESCWVHHKPPTSLALSAVVFYSFVFLVIAWFLKWLSRALASFKEVEVRDFLLCFRTSFQVVFGDKLRLSQKVSQTESNNIRLTLVAYRFFEPRRCHKNCHKAVKLPLIRSFASMIFSSLLWT